jgi:O-antigen ligase
MPDYVEAGRRPFGGGARDGTTRVTAVVHASDEPRGLERAAYYSLLAFAASLQLSIAAAEVLLTVTGVLWVALLVARRERVTVPSMFWPLAAYAGATLVSAAFSVDPVKSIIDCKQLLLFSIVPIAYRLLPGGRTLTVVDVIITVGAITAVLGIVQFGIFKFDHLGQRPKGALGLYMTYSGQLMLVACTATARILFRKDDRVWASLVMPALIVALVTTLTRSAWIGACAGIGLLFLMRDLRFAALLPVVAALFIAFAPAGLTERLYSSFRLDKLRHDSAEMQAGVQSNQDRVFMLQSGLRIVRDHPLTGVGPDMVREVYPQHRHPDAVNRLNPHLHNVPLQIAAERGLPALVIWLWFVGALLRDFIVRRRTTRIPSLATAALACVVAMLAAGLFEYNFGDSEFLMLFLVIVTLPYAADREAGARPAGHGAPPAPATTRPAAHA